MTISSATISLEKQPVPRNRRRKNYARVRWFAGEYDLVLDPTNLWLTIHESAGHPTELDRALGWEANFAGTRRFAHRTSSANFNTAAN